ncbi:uncharacterized protein MYCGRDRAFT_96349 [Zymoseptoria tritici IPO323]|uniref:Uncharacterized protein n=1 Tax=Zymoseptoria tritici (strain CBS 115943 / IPO323) TaxID=336722 RepID=F9XLU5_ZYMTI|nr:uncharacterized protein MYCGRDRAFT_96349 [Zymoseptoria tritici IPO323]EGP84029.1 hypothetical protein MYCGRDRAFT_96349 [Zymoseptoria tritici IPO323]
MGYVQLPVCSKGATEPSTEEARYSKPTDHPGEFYDESGNMNKTKFYDFFLKHIKTKPAKWDDPGDWLGRIHVDTELLPPALQDRPLDYFASDSPELPMAQRCLEHFITLTARGRSKDEQRRQYCNEQNLPGSRALIWLFRDYNSADLSINFGFLKALVHCMVAEGAESHIWSWLKIPHIPTVLMPQEGRDRIAWRGPMLRFLVESQAYWAEGADGINAALRSFEYTWSFDVPFLKAWQEEQSPLAITKELAGVWILKQLMFKGANTTADVQLYDRFIWRISSWTQVFSGRLNRADLHRKHPSRPTALPALEFMRHYQQIDPRPGYVHELFQSWGGFAFLINSAKMLEQQGYEQEARWMLDIGLLEMPNYFKPKARNEEKTRGSFFGYKAGNPGERRPVPSGNNRQFIQSAALSDTTGPRIR